MHSIQPYICPMGIPQSISERCPKCGATEDTDEGCLGWGAAQDAELAARQSKVTVERNY